MEPSYRDGNGNPTDEPSIRLAYAEEHGELDKPRQLSVEDRLRAENAQLRVHNLMMQKEQFIAGANKQIETFDTRLIALKAEILKMQEEFKAKYDVDFTKEQIESETGRIIPAP